MKVIEFKNVKKDFGKWNIIKDISVEFEKGKTYAVMGPSGAGKTTFLNLASGLEKPTSGEIIINTKNVGEMKEPKLTKFRVKNISYIFQDYNIIDYLTVYENVVLSMKLSHSKIDSLKVEEILKRVNLFELRKKNVMQLSGGQKQRVAIARALISNSEIIFADEPTGALDLNTRDEVIELLSEMSSIYKKTLIIITHDPKVATIADKIVYFLSGEISSVEDKESAENIATRLLELEHNVNNSN
ncbi:ABC transporter ATP-binding protein [Spiroplasma endosymbiont of Othius punctulatus]|uniref:ABC transporter ATP-binding protein n=1 Tax=Spiroplasma endosymbiont of Othius punctulatus TaxID=3066289 RepID=UPI0030D0EFC1